MGRRLAALPLLLLAGAWAEAADWRSAMKTYEKPDAEQLRGRLTPLQYEVTQEEGTEPPFKNEFWDNHRDGIYVDVVSGEPLFSSLDKFESGTGWPSFVRPLVKDNVAEKTDRGFFMVRTEVRSARGDSHLGHVFPDGPKPTGLRYCINSASLRFVPVEDLEKEGYGEFLGAFVKAGRGPSTGTLETATLAGGCFWGVEDLMRKLPGVVETEVGYTGGSAKDPVYETVKKGGSGHAEAVRVRFDPKKVSYEKVLEHFFRLHDPTTLDRQGNDTGSQYRSAVFYHDDAQRKAAEKVKARVDASGKWKAPVVTEIVKAGAWTRAEDYHQDYLQKNPQGYTCHFLRD